jgi:4-carboxymuconolactone decarboxylase
MAHLLGGFPRAIEGILELGKALQQAGRSWPDEQPLSPSSRSKDHASGRQLFAEIYGKQAEPVLQKLRDNLPGFETWVLEHAYGRVLSRPGLDSWERELLAVAALVVLRCPAQLVSHVRGALRCGASRPQVLAVLELLEEDYEPGLVRQGRADIEPLLSSG